MARVRSGRSLLKAADRLDEHVHALSGHEPAHAHDEPALGGKPQSPTAATRSSELERVEALVVDAGGHDDDRGRSCPGRAGRLSARVTAGGDGERGTREHRAQQLARTPGARPGTVTSAPCRTTP